MSGDAPSRRGTHQEKRGGYGSSSKRVTKLNPPPKGPAPGARSTPPAARKSS